MFFFRVISGAWTVHVLLYILGIGGAHTDLLLRVEDARQWQVVQCLQT